jgi:hypothetical protein
MYIFRTKLVDHREDVSHIGLSALAGDFDSAADQHSLEDAVASVSRHPAEI